MPNKKTSPRAADGVVHLYCDRHIPFISLALNPLCYVTKVCIFVLACSELPSSLFKGVHLNTSKYQNPTSKKKIR